MVKKHKERTDEELFGNTDDIFGDLPANPKSPKPKKKKKASEAAGTSRGGGEGTGGGGSESECKAQQACSTLMK